MGDALIRYQATKPGTGQIRNLLYHVWPVKDRGVWQWNVAQLLRRIGQFNGQRIVSVVTDEQTDTFQAVKDAFRGTVTHFIHHRNDATLGEVVSFPELMNRIENIDPRQMTFYAHAKGVKYKSGTQPMVRRWAQVMYANLLDYPATIEDALTRHAMVGTFKKHGNAFGSLPPAWHFAGTFFWFKNAAIFGQPTWSHVPRQWWGTEAWPAVICPNEMAACHLFEGNAPTLQLYQQATWAAGVDAVWKRWQIDNAPRLRRQSYAEVRTSLTTKRIVVTGPQRSGTTIAATMLAKDLSLPFVSETEFDTHDFGKFSKILAEKKEFVIQAPTMSPYVHQLQGCEVVWMRRNLPDILRSQDRVDWIGEEQERDRYFDHSHDPIAVVKARAWDLFQRVALGESAFDLDYESLCGHPLWVDKELRLDFTHRQTAAAASVAQPLQGHANGHAHHHHHHHHHHPHPYQG